MEIRTEVQDLLEEVTSIRRALHKIPELELNTVKTRQYIVETLQAYGGFEIEEGYAQNGVVAYLRVNEKKSCIAFRADMDALPMKEENQVSFASVHEGASHCCGHDGHMAILLGFAKYLVAHKDALKENILLIFQPGEEGPGGAKQMIAEGLFQKYPIRYVFGTHLMSDIEKGKVSCKEGAMMARNGECNIEIHGQSAHGAMPYLGKDAIVAASALVMQLQTIVSRNLDPLHATILTIGKMEGGQARNVICDHVSLLGTIRAFHDESYETLKSRMKEVCEGIEKIYGVQIDLRISDFYYAVNNDEALHNVLKEAIKGSYVRQEPKMIAEDFSFYQREVPGLFYFTGVKDENYQKGIHDCQFNFDEKALLVSIETNLRLLEQLEVLV